MARSKESFNKKEVKKNKDRKRKEKEQRKQDKKHQEKKEFDDMIAWVDENGNLMSTPPDLSGKKEIKADNIEIGIPKAEFRVNARFRTGRLKSFEKSKGFGFITDSITKESVFVHISNCLEPIEMGNRVKYETEKGNRGLQAINVKLE